MSIELKPLPFGNYYLLERLAVGGMAEVYLAKCFGVAGFERLVALKRILPTIAEDDEFIAMFIDEAKIAGQLSHANIAQIFDLGKINHSYFIAMEYISGHDLRALWDRAREAGGLPLPLACYVAQKICEGLDYAHRRRDNRGRPLGIIHRDVSPQNVLLSYDGDIKVIDFGIAKAANRMVRTQTGILKGKFAYMAPEQARGDPTDHRADIFAIGVILYELLTGERAFRAESDYALLEKVRKVDVVPPRKLKPEIPKELERIVYKALAREAGDRYAWASALAADLDRFMGASGLAYNKAELAAFVRRAFRDEWQEEQRRLKLYQGYRPDDGKEENQGPTEEVPRAGEPRPASRVAALDDGDGDDGTKVLPSLSDEEASSDFGGSIEPTRALPPEQATQAWQGGAPFARDASSDDALDFDSQYTVPLDALPEQQRHALVGGNAPESLTSTDAEKAERAEQAAKAAPGGRVVEARGAGSAARPLGDNVVGDRRVVGAQETQVHAAPADLPWAPRVSASASGDDATMVDSFPVSSSDEDAARPRRRSARREGTRPDAARPESGRRAGSSLGLAAPGGTSASALSRSSVSTPSRAPRPATRARLDEPLPSAPHVPAPERESFDPPLPPPMMDGGTMPRARRPSKALVGGAAAGLVAGALLVVLAGLAFLPGGPNTFLVVSPGSAQVSLGDEVLCERTPCAVHLPPGTHELLLSGEGAGLLAKSVTVAAEGVTIVEVSMRQRRVLRLETRPAGAKVTLNGTPLEGLSPLSLPELAVGERVKLKLELEGYEPHEELVEVPDAEDGAWRFDLLAARTAWSVDVEPEDAVVVADGRRGRQGDAKLEVPRGETLVVHVVRPGCEPLSRALVGTGKDEEKLEAKLTCKPFDGKVSIGSALSADIEIDGVPIGARTPLRQYPIPAGPHVVMLRRRGNAEPFAVFVPAGENALLNTRFK